MGQAKEETKDNVTNLSNSKDIEKIIVQCAKDMAAIDEQRKHLTRQAADIRTTLKDKGVDTDAFRESYQYHKKKRHEKDGFDESSKLCMDALNAADTGNMFAWMDDKE